MLLMCEPKARVLYVFVFPNLEEHLCLVVVVWVGKHRPDRLLGLHLIPLLHVDGGQTRIHRAVITVLDDYGVRSAHHETTGHLALIHGAYGCTAGRLDVYAYVFYLCLFLGYCFLAALATKNYFNGWLS